MAGEARHSPIRYAKDEEESEVQQGLWVGVDSFNQVEEGGDMLRHIAIFMLAVCLCGVALAEEMFNLEELTLSKVREIFFTRGIEISGRTFGKKELLEIEKLKMEMEVAKAMMTQAKIEVEKKYGDIAKKFADEAKRWDLSNKDIDLIVALHYANIAMCPVETPHRLFSGKEPITFVSFYAMVRRFYDRGRPVMVENKAGETIEKFPSEYSEFLDYFIDYLKTHYMNCPDNLKEVTLLFLPEKTEEVEE